MATVPRGFADLLAAEITRPGRRRTCATAPAASASKVRWPSATACLPGIAAGQSRAAADRARTDDRYRRISTTWRAASTGAITWIRAVRWPANSPASIRAINNTHFGALKLKDAHRDQLRDATRTRPSIETQRPDLRVHAHAAARRGGAVDRPGGRVAEPPGLPPRRAAKRRCARTSPPASCCARAGRASRRLAVNSSIPCAARAPSPSRRRGSRRTRRRDCCATSGVSRAGAVTTPALWNDCWRPRGRGCKQQVPVIVRGADRNRGAIATAQANARRARVGRDLVFEHCDIAELAPTNDGADAPPGLLCVNPPYGATHRGQR